MVHSRFWLQVFSVYLNMVRVTTTLLVLCSMYRSVWSIDSGPTFPNGVAALVADMRDRLTSASVEHGDDAEAIAHLKSEGLAAIAEDLAYEQQSNLLATAAFAMVQTRVLKAEYVGGCPRDMNGCPSLWADQSNGLCEPPDDYEGLCVAFNARGFSVAEKEQFAWKCRASWPCVPSCKLDFETCPDSWENLNGLCLAPSSYDGVCSPAMMFSSFTRQQKAEWAAMCSARWPCASFE